MLNVSETLIEPTLCKHRLEFIIDMPTNIIFIYRFSILIIDWLKLIICIIILFIH